MNDESGLPGAIAAARFQYFQLARQLLEADPLVAGIDAATVRLTDQLKAGGWRLTVEVSADSADRTTIALTAVSTEGKRMVFRTMQEDLAGAQ